VPAGSSERTGCEGARPSAVPVCLRPCRDDALSDAVQAAAAWATTTKAAAVAVPAMWPGAAMSRGLGVWQRRLLAALEERPTDPKVRYRVIDRDGDTWFGEFKTMLAPEASRGWAPNRLMMHADTAVQDKPRKRPPGPRSHDVPGA
jgi:hypothetical protein